MNSIGVIAFTRKGCALARRIVLGLQSVTDYSRADFSLYGPSRFADEEGVDAYGDFASWTAEHFAHDDALIFVCASGIVVRAIAPHVRDKFTDPAIVSVDEVGRFVIPLLSGHVGGANELARAVADVTKGQAVVSTATDVNNLFAVDEWAIRNGLTILERSIAKDISATLLEGGTVGFQSDFEFDWNLPQGVTDGAASLGFIISLSETAQPFTRTLHLVPRVVTVGVGCRKGIDSSTLRNAVYDALSEAHVSPCAVRTLASIDVKRNEPAIRALAMSEDWNLKFYSAEQLAAVPGKFSSSEFVERTVGVSNVCERAACAGGGMLMLGKHAGDGVTVALAFEKPSLVMGREDKGASLSSL